ncbi:hypothetical protein BIWAKO_06649 [Bosea sp. BIWAKO-01]|nr:hypothetical protein BIWAKO_06649 [Bosea sp. BIWAKO-01]
MFFATIAEQMISGPRMDTPAPARVLAILVISAPAILPSGGTESPN